MKRTHSGAVGVGAGRRSAVLALVVAAGGMAGLTGCGGGSGTIGAFTPPATSFSPNPSNFTGTAPSALASQKSSALASVSAAASSASANAASFEASVSAASARSKAAATAALASVSGPGNAVSAVTVTGVPRSSSGGLNAAMVTIVNSSMSRASYAVRINFNDSAGDVLDSTVVGVENLDPGKKATPIAFSTLATDLALLPTVAQAERY